MTLRIFQLTSKPVNSVSCEQIRVVKTSWSSLYFAFFSILILNSNLFFIFLAYPSAPFSRYRSGFSQLRFRSSRLSQAERLLTKFCPLCFQNLPRGRLRRCYNPLRIVNSVYHTKPDMVCHIYNCSIIFWLFNFNLYNINHYD